MKIFEIFYQPNGPVGELNQPVHWVRFAGNVVWVLCFVYVGSWPFGVGIALHLSCRIPEFVRKVMKLNQMVHWVIFFRTTVLVLCFVCVGSWSFVVGIALRLSCWIPNFVRKVLTSFEFFSPLDGLVGKQN